MKPLLSIHQKNALILGIVLLGMTPFGWAAVKAAALGGGMQILNLRGLERSVVGMLGLAVAGQSTAARALITLRWIFLFGAIAAVLFLAEIEPIAFITGLSILVPTVIWHGLEDARLQHHNSEF